MYCCRVEYQIFKGSFVYYLPCFIIDLGEALDASGLGINMNGVTGKLNMLLYADDLTLIADTEEDMQ